MTSTTSDTMKVGAESAGLRKIVQGCDGAGWVALIDAAPMRTLPPGAAALVVEYFRALLDARQPVAPAPARAPSSAEQYYAHRLEQMGDTP